ncbi:hypothetical protein AQUCO_01400268v1 [Aquilegia coerulea]|uniref:Uncharacterized protein n=1 Tax=Aquilegia coerulea TaxID=218851 RepID=A0A2G5DVH6_AQUCA|nr:hypothetical protein AQUCO_01400268v1 [Aquilegia coerulea]
MMKMVNPFSWNGSGRRGLSFGSPRVPNSPRVGFYRKSLVSRSFEILIVICLLLSFLIAMGCGYIYVFPNLSQAIHAYGVLPDNSSIATCDVFEGNWIRDTSYPLYNGSECPFAEQGFNCLANGRKDDEYLKWRWKPYSCDIPRFNVHKILEGLRGKRIVFVGDSMSRTQWESLICLLMTGVEDKKSVYEVNGNKITKQIRFLGVRFGSFNFTVEFYRSVYLVQPGPKPRHSPKRVKWTLKLDNLDDISRQWIDSDVLIFNTGQWWNEGKLFETDQGRRRFCNMTQEPISETKGKDQSPFSDIISEVVKNMTVPVTILRVTRMGAFRSDAHVGRWSDARSVVDCSHWCLPGVPDMWNEIVFSYLLLNDGF